MTDKNGRLSVFFDDLKPGKNYVACYTASSYLPYEPTLLWNNEDVIISKFSTMYNPNLMASNRHIDELKLYNPGLGEALDRFIKNQEQKKQRGRNQLYSK